MTAALILADSRFPGGGHVHSGGLEEAASRGIVTSVPDLARFLTTRLRTAGSLAATFAAAATQLVGRNAPLRASNARNGALRQSWRELDAELDARTPSVAQRVASRGQGKATLRAGRVAWPSAVLDELGAEPHHAIVIGVLVGIGGGQPKEAAMTAAYLAVSGPASAAVRLLGLDPFAVNAAVARLAPEIEDIAAAAAQTAARPAAELPAPGSPVLDILAEAHDRHHREEVRLFAS